MRFPASRAYHVIYNDSLEDAIRYAAANDWTGRDWTCGPVDYCYLHGQVRNKVSL